MRHDKAGRGVPGGVIKSEDVAINQRKGTHRPIEGSNRLGRRPGEIMSLCVAHGSSQIASKAGLGARDGKAGSAGGRRHKASGRTRLARAPAGSAANRGEDGAALRRPQGHRGKRAGGVARGPRIRKGPPRRERPLSILHRNVWENTLDPF